MRAELERYARVEVPRYTSYPTAAQFHDGVGEESYRAWLGGLTRDYVERLRESHALKQCMEGLRAPQREAIAMAFFQGLSHGQLSESLEQPIGTVKSWIRRGLTQLRRCLER